MIAETSQELLEMFEEELNIIRQYYPEKVENLKKVLQENHELTNKFGYERCFYGALVGTFNTILAADSGMFKMRREAFYMSININRILRQKYNGEKCTYSTPIESALDDSYTYNMLMTFLRQEILGE